MTVARTFSVINKAKADFSSIYVQPDPRAYFRELGGLDYVIPHLAQPIFRQLAEARIRAKGGPITVLDLGCSYGVNGALMKYPLTLDVMQDRYTNRAMQELSPEELCAFDRRFFSSWPTRTDLRVIGLDVSREAVAYAERCGAIDHGIVRDLETEELATEEREALAAVDMIVSTGCVGYVTSKTFDKLAACTIQGHVPWVASFVLRMFAYDPIAATLARQGLPTERFEGATFIQRRFRDEQEMGATLTALAERGISAAGKESEGLFHAELFVSRPREEIAAAPINGILSIASGANRRYAPTARMRPRRSRPG